MQQIQWQDRFNIGVEIVDQAHRRLFSIVGKIMELYVERHDSKFACVEGIKYFKAYALKHFSEEEAYMREIGYAGYAAHKRLHDRMRRETLPDLERELYATDFSTAAVQRFIGVCTGWLTGHIMVEDRAITGRAAGGALFPSDGTEPEQAVIQTVIVRPLQELFGINIQYAGKYSEKDVITDSCCYEMLYSDREGGPKLRVAMIMREELLLHAAGQVFGIDFFSMDEIARFAICEIAQSLLQRAAACLGRDSVTYYLERERFLDLDEYRQGRGEPAEQYSLLFCAKRDCFALCAERIDETSEQAT